VKLEPVVFEYLLSTTPFMMVIVITVGAVATLVSLRQKQIARIARDLIFNYLKDKNWEMMSFERIRENVNKSYSDVFLASLPARFPDTFRKAKLRDKDGALTKPGLARIMQSEDADDAQRLSISDVLQSSSSLESLEHFRDALDKIIQEARAAKMGGAQE
jgi:hypothetical protein